MNNINIENFNNKQFDIFGIIFTIKLIDTYYANRRYNQYFK